MTRRWFGALAFFAAAALCPAQSSLTIQGVDGKAVELSAADLSKMTQETFTAGDHGTTVSFEGVPLAEVLGKAALPTGEKFHGSGASYYVVIEAKDGYRAVFAWAELDSGFMDKPVYLALKRDRKPLSDKDGPFQVVAPGEKRAARWVRQVTAIRIRPAI
ncbi:MAG TPA: molybdopterin-dependent oxidoreductase [Bryobacteraceae bacterium]|nr:molybdopterin-dependent oxidoreductase [Bryobacteraceae bacterium]